MNRVISTTDTDVLQSGGNSAVLELTGGDRLQIFNYVSITIAGGPQQIFSTFSGYLLSAAAPSAEFVGK